jgi:hypothetical protein
VREGPYYGFETREGGRTQFHDTSQYKLFSNEPEPITALLAAMAIQNLTEKPDDYADEEWMITRRASRDSAIWRCALMRTSSREEDVVYSIMGLFGVKVVLPADMVKTRAAAITTLCRAILEKGGRAHWLATSLSSRQGIIPVTPISTSKGPPVIRTRGYDDIEAYKLLKDLNWFLKNAPTGKIDKNGFMEFSNVKLSDVTIGPIYPVARQEDATVGFEFTSDSITARGRSAPLWGLSGDVGTRAIVIGMLDTYAHFRDDGVPVIDDGSLDCFILLLLNHRAVDDTWYKTGMAAVSATFAELWPSGMIRCTDVQGMA